MSTTIGGKPASCDDCAFDKLAPIGTAFDPLPPIKGLRKMRDANGEAVFVEADFEAARMTVVEAPRCCADRDPVDFPAARICARFAAR